MQLTADIEPISFFQNWIKEAAATEPNDPEAMALATVDDKGMPSVRMVLMKGVDHQGFRFFTNKTSRKAKELLATRRAAACFHWKSLLRQVRIEGVIEELPQSDADHYFKTRHPLSRLGAWASAQSQPLKDRATLEAEVAAIAEKFSGQDIPCPPFWGGFILQPQSIEFWQQGEGRLHDRFVFTRVAQGWGCQRLYP